MQELEFENIMRQVEGGNAGRADGAKPSDEEKEEFKGIAERRVRLGLILAEVGNKNNITVSDVELQRAVITEAQRYPGQERQVFDFYSKNRNALESLRAPVFEEKVVDFILDLATLTEKTVAPDELMNAIEAEEEDLKQTKSSSKKADKSEGDEKPKAAAKKKK
jgi:trigger factor